MFYGACLDTLALKSVFGLRKDRDYAAFDGFKFKKNESQRIFKFGDSKTNGIGTIAVRLPQPGHSYIKIMVDDVKPNIPVLKGLDDANKFGLYMKNIRYLLAHDKACWSIPLDRKMGKIYCTSIRKYFFHLAN